MAQNYEKIIILLEQSILEGGKRSGAPLGDFWKKIANTHRVFMYSQGHPDINNLSSEEFFLTLMEARKNFIINLVTATEVFLKDLVKLLCDQKPSIITKEGLDELLKERISLAEARSLFQEKNPSLGQLVSASLTFGSLSDIAFVFDKLTGKKFLDELGALTFPANIIEKKSGKESICLDVDFEKWLPTLDGMFKERHKYVHQINFQDPIEQDDVYRMVEAASCLTSAASFYFDLPRALG